MPATKPIDELRAEAAKLIINRLDKSTISQAARDLGVSRQALYDIRRKAYCPSLALIQRACEVWGLEFSVRGLQIGKTTLRAKKKSSVLQTQPSLFDALGVLQNQHLQVIRTKRMRRALEVVLRVTLSA